MLVTACHERGAEQAYLSLGEPDESPMPHLQGHSIAYRVALGPQAGRKVFTLRTLPPSGDDFDEAAPGRADGFSLHADVAKAHQRKKLERLCRYVCRPRREGHLWWSARSAKDM
jgi:hypothetical protein